MHSVDMCGAQSQKSSAWPITKCWNMSPGGEVRSAHVHLLSSKMAGLEHSVSKTPFYASSALKESRKDSSDFVKTKRKWR